MTLVVNQIKLILLKISFNYCYRFNLRGRLYIRNNWRIKLCLIRLLGGFMITNNPNITQTTKQHIQIKDKQKIPNY